MGKLSAKRIKGLTEKGRYGDGDNLYLCVGGGGRKSWALLYTIAGQNRQMGLGPLDDDFGLTEARDRAAELRRMIRRGVDPLAEKRAERAKAAPTVVTFREVAEDCIASLVPGWTNGKSEGQWRQSLGASRQVLDDGGQLRTLIDGELRYGLALREEMQLLLGDGAGTNLLGLIPQATAYDDTGEAANASKFDVVLNAIAQAERADLPATGIVVNSTDWLRLQGLKDSEGRYIGSGPMGTAMATAWGLDVAPSGLAPLKWRGICSA